uniref:Uncharacterized protein n=1 Tax=Solibacter usitatus (strain Ellin6076) TaxID=234267 RepID=Q020Z6_SOLUE
MDWLEQELKQALARQEPDPGFDDRVRRRQVRVMPRAIERWAAIAAMLVVGVAAGEGYRWHRGQVAKEQVMMAMRIAGDRLNRVQVQLVRGSRQ